MIFQRTKHKKVTCKLQPYPEGRSHLVKLFHDQLRLRDVVITDTVADDRQVIFMQSPPSKQWLSMWWSALYDMNLIPDAGDKEGFDCEDLVRALQDWAAKGRLHYGHRSRGGIGIMRLYVRYGATSWGQDVTGKIPGGSGHQLAVVATDHGPWVIDAQTADSISLDGLIKLTGVKQMFAKW